MLTPVEIKSKTFKGTFGYNKKDVDTFMYQVLENYETLYKTNKELDEKNGVLASNLASYKTIESQLEKSLVLAQKAADDTKAAAKKEAELIEKNARLEAQKMLCDAKRNLKEIEQKIADLTAQYEAYKAQIKSVSMAQIELIESNVVKKPAVEVQSLDMDKLEAAFNEKTDNDMTYDEINAVKNASVAVEDEILREAAASDDEIYKNIIDLSETGEN